MALAGEPPRQDLQEVRGRAASSRSLPRCCFYGGWPPPCTNERGEQEDAPHAAFTVRRGRAGVAFASLVADDAYRGCNACRAVSPPLAREAALGAVLQPLIERSVAARALAMNASPQPLRHAAVTAATGRVARLSTKINPMRSTASTRFPLLLRSLGGLAEDQSGNLKPAG